jgi:tetratricopeptide (TPR) repeat protein
MLTNVDSILQQAAEALKNKQYPQAEDLQRQACEILREQAAEGSRLAAELETLADIHCTQRKFEACANEYAEVVQLREKLLPENDYSILRPLYRLAKSHFEDQKYESAEGEMRRALALAETRNDSPESVAFCLYELGWLLYYVGKYREAEPYFIKALPISETTDGASHHQTVRVLSGIALLYSNCDDLGKDPEPYFRKVIDATKAEKDLRETYLTNLCRLASHFAEHKRLEEADELFLQLVKLVGDAAGLSDSDSHWISDLLENPKRGPVIEGTSGVRKSRAADPTRGKGKSGGFRYMYYSIERDAQIFC